MRKIKLYDRRFSLTIMTNIILLPFNSYNGKLATQKVVRSTCLDKCKTKRINEYKNLAITTRVFGKRVGWISQPS